MNLTQEQKSNIDNLKLRLEQVGLSMNIPSDRIKFYQDNLSISCLEFIAGGGQVSDEKIKNSLIGQELFLGLGSAINNYLNALKNFD